jgi:hypothetical protein
MKTDRTMMIRNISHDTLLKHIFLKREIWTHLERGDRVIYGAGHQVVLAGNLVVQACVEQLEQFVPACGDG